MSVADDDGGYVARAPNAVRRGLLGTALAFALPACRGRSEAAVIAAAAAPAAAPRPVAPASFPLSVSADRRYLVDAAGQPFPILGRTAWFLMSLGRAEQLAFVEDSVERGFNAIELHIVNHDPRGNRPPFGDGGALLPFERRLDGERWTGSLTYARIDRDAPDFTSMNDPYWLLADDLLEHCARRGVLVLVFGAYVGFKGREQGWMKEMLANGDERIRRYGAALAQRWAGRPNLVWMLAGDHGGGSGPFSAAEASCVDAYIEGLSSTPGRSALYSAELASESTAADPSTPRMQRTVNLNGAYSWNGKTAAQGRRAYAQRAGPAYLLEGPYDEEGPDGNRVNPHAVPPVRRFVWRGWLSTIGGYVAGNGYVWPFGPEYPRHLGTPGTSDLTVLNRFIGSIEWWRLVPEWRAPQGPLIDPASRADEDDAVTAAATPQGDLLLAHVGPTRKASFSVDLRKLHPRVTARWLDPSTGSYAMIGTFANTGWRTFASPGANASGASDWVLRIDAA